MTKNKESTLGREPLEYAVYGGICGMLGVMVFIFLFIAVVLESCRPPIYLSVGRSLICIILSIMTLYFGYQARATKQGITVILLGIAVLLLVGILYIVGIIPCVVS